MLTNHFVDEDTDTHHIYKRTIVLSRYLYSIIDVKQSLFLSILEHNIEQAMFWGYELYFSGLQEETFDYLLDISRILFQIDFLDCDEDNDMIDLVNYCKYVWGYRPTNRITSSVIVFPQCVAITIIWRHLLKNISRNT